MADRGASGAAPARGGGFGSRGGDRGGRGGDRGRGRGRGRGRRGGKSDEKEWQPVTKLGRLVKAGKINSMEEIYLHSLPIKEYQIVDNFLPKLKDEVMKVRRRRRRSPPIAPYFQCSGKASEARKRRNGKSEWFADHTPKTTDQARPEADPCRSAHPLQGHCHHW
jgi:hypothetical protein